MNEHAEPHTVTQMSLLHVIGYFCNTVSRVTDIANKIYINIIYQLTLCITVSANLKFCTETDTYIIYPLLSYVPVNYCEFNKNIPITYTNTIINWKCLSHLLVKAYLAFIMNTIITSTDVTIYNIKEICREFILQCKSV